MSDTLASLTNDEKQIISYSTGLNADGTLATVTGWRWDRNYPPTYNNAGGSAHKWGGGTAGTAGGTVTYWLDPGSNWTPAEQSSFIASMTLWSDIANITFAPASSLADAELSFYRYTSPTPPPGGLDDGAYALPTYTAGSPGATTIPATQSVYISIETEGAQANLDSFTTQGGQGPGTIVHELGHVIGLMHTGPYNGNVDVATQQLNPDDTQLWSTMSYISPSDTAAKYFADYPVTGTQWGATADGTDREPTTPMPLDILGAQQLYGLPTSTTFSGGQVFGFNCNISDASKPFFDFTVNTTPVITIWDSGIDNTLDLSGYSMSCTVNLNPGTFSSVAGLINNVGIAYNTRIDNAIGGTGNDLFITNLDSDFIEGDGGIDTVQLTGAFDQYLLTRSGNVVTATAENASVGGVYTLEDITWLTFADQTINTDSIACFATGTRIATPNGEVAVEDLAEGDLVLTADGEALPIVWLGRRQVNCAAHPQADAVLPIRVRAHAFGPDLPARDLLLSPDHAIFADGILVPVKHLIDGRAICQLDVDRVTYWHVELPRHELILANGLPTESYLETGGRSAFENGDVVMLHADFASVLQEARCAALTVSGPQLTRLRRRLAA